MMKKTLLSLFALSASLVGFAANPNPFAYAVSGEYDALTLDVAYSLNTDADKAEVQILKNGTVVKTQEVSATAGENTAEIDLSGLADGDYTWQIAVTGGQKTTDDGASMSLFKTWKFYHPAGLDVDNSFESESFGTIFVAEGKHPKGLEDSSYTGGQPGSDYVSYPNNNGEVDNAGGLYMFTPDLQSITGKDGYARFYDSDLTWNATYVTSSSGSDFIQVAIADDGRIFTARYNSSGDYILSAPSVADLVENGNFTSLVAGKTMTDAVYKDANGNFLLGAIQSLDVTGAGENTKLVALTRNTNSVTIAPSINSIVEYAIGSSNNLPEPKKISPFDASYALSYDRAANVRYDNRGGIWFNQYQTQDDKVRMAYIDAAGKELYKNTTTSNNKRRAAIAINPDGTRLAQCGSTNGDIIINELTYDENGAPVLTEKYTTNAGGQNMYAFAWDAAGNIYGANASQEYVKGYAVPRADNTFATKAASKYNFTVDTATGVETIGADNAPVEYYNLQGVKVENPENGIFIKKQGNKAVKVIL